MTRLLVLFSLLASCTTAEDLTRFTNRNPAMRTLDYGNVFEFGTRTQAATAALAGDDRAFLLYDSISTRNPYCIELEVFRIQDVESGRRSASQTISGCRNNPPPDNFDHLSYASGTLLVGSQVYVANADGLLEFESDLAGTVPIINELDNGHVIDRDHVLLATTETTYLIVREGETWVNTHRFLNTAAEPNLGASDDLLLAGWTLYGRQGGDWVAIEESRSFTDLEGDTVMDVRNQTFNHDGSSLVPLGTSPTPSSIQVTLLQSGTAWMEDDQLVVADLDFTSPRREVLIRDGWETRLFDARENSLVLTAGPRWSTGAQNLWVRVTDRSAQGQVLSEDVTVTRDTISSHSFTVDPDARRLTVELSGTGDADLYVRQGQAPTRTEWDCAPYRWGSAEVCTLPNPEAGEWFVDVVGFDDSSEVLVTAHVD